MDIYTDYANWKFENHDLISELVKNKSKTISRFTSVIVVVDYLYDVFVKTKSLSNDEEFIFSIGYDYIYDNFYTIETILNQTFNKDFKEMEKYAKNINLLLYINEFIAEANDKNIDSTRLEELKNTVTNYIDNKKVVPDEYFLMFDEISSDLLDGYDIQTVEQIFYEIAIEYNIYQDDDESFYNAYLSNKIAGNIK